MNVTLSDVSTYIFSKHGLLMLCYDNDCPAADIRAFNAGARVQEKESRPEKCKTPYLRLPDHGPDISTGCGEVFDRH